MALKKGKAMKFTYEDVKNHVVFNITHNGGLIPQLFDSDSVASKTIVREDLGIKIVVDCSLDEDGLPLLSCDYEFDPPMSGEQYTDVGCIESNSINDLSVKLTKKLNECVSEIGI